MHIDMTKTKGEKAKVISADRSLQTKVGTGEISKTSIEKSQKVMDTNQIDFEPMAMKYLKDLGQAIALAKTGADTQKTIKALKTPVMQLKGNASVFQYDLIGKLANVMLNFLQAVKVVDEDAIAIIEAHQKTLTAIVMKKMKGNGGRFGQQMEKELVDACRRYEAKKLLAK